MRNQYHPAMPTQPSRERFLGLLSDTHGRAERCREAIIRLKGAGAQAFIHCGDIGEEAAFDAMAGEKGWFVWGNTDIHRAPLSRYAADLGLTCLDNGGELTFAGRRLYVTHGDDFQKVQAICSRAEQGDNPAEVPDFLLTGHTHVPHDRHYGAMRWINPGALHRARPRTAALLDVESGDLTTLEFD